MKPTQPQDAATARPWIKETSDGGVVTLTDSATESVLIARVMTFPTTSGNGQANAALIVKAVNLYDALVAVAEAAKAIDIAIATGMENGFTNIQNKLQNALANLAKVRGKEGV